MMKNNAQVTGNAGLYFVCYNLSLCGWNVIPTSRNARGVDIIAYNSDCRQTISIQVKTLSRRNPVPLGRSVEGLMGNYWVIVTDIWNSPKAYIMKPEDVRKNAHRGERDGRVSYWLQPKSYEGFRENWGILPES